jgi:hypothetical protein
MTIETKYNVDDEVWYKGTEEIVRDCIVNIKIEIDILQNQTIIYELWDGGICNENELFPTKEELLKSL